jgi:hypothetical protein
MFGIVALIETFFGQGQVAWYLAAVVHFVAALLYVTEVRDITAAALFIVTALELLAGWQVRPATDRPERREPPVADAA